MADGILIVLRKRGKKAVVTKPGGVLFTTAVEAREATKHHLANGWKRADLEFPYADENERHCTRLIEHAPAPEPAHA